MTVYVVVFVFLMVLSFMELFAGIRRNTRFFQGILLVTLLVLTTVRGGERADYVAYKEVYIYAVNTSSLFAKGNFLLEPLYCLLQWLCKSVVDNFQFFLFVIGSLVIFFEHRFAMSFSVGSRESDGKIRYSLEGQYYFTIFFILWGVCLANVYVIRSTIALVICLYSLQFIWKKKFGKFVLCVIIAVGFHYSALVFFPAYFIFWCKAKLITKVNIFILGSVLFSIMIRPVALIVSRIFGGVVGGKIQNYLGATDLMASTGMEGSSVALTLIKILLNIGLILVIGIYSWKFNKKDRYYGGYMNLYITGSILRIAALTVGYAFARLSIYYNIFQVPILVYAIKGNGKDNSNRKIYWLVLVLYLMVRFTIDNIGEPFVAYWQ